MILLMSACHRISLLGTWTIIKCFFIFRRKLTDSRWRKPHNLATRPKLQAQSQVPGQGLGRQGPKPRPQAAKILALRPRSRPNIPGRLQRKNAKCPTSTNVVSYTIDDTIVTSSIDLLISRTGYWLTGLTGELWPNDCTDQDAMLHGI